jgi:isoaspartyl peptidase/L-asparaginase-like protein (Ntn-hydrolase superfamily)
MLATWTFGQPALAAAWDEFENGVGALDAVETACRYAESDLANHTVGIGGLPDRDGRVSLDAAIMLSPSQCAGVCFVRKVGHPISLARAVMERTQHKLLAGDGAEQFAMEQGFAFDELLIEPAKRRWQEWKASKLDVDANGSPSTQPSANFEEQFPHISHRERNELHDTIGVLALDRDGVVAAGCTTSGLPWKHPGRIGDSPIIGQRLYADPAVGACVCTGHGELVSGVCGAFLAVEKLRQGCSPVDAAAEVLQRIAGNYRLSEKDQVGVIVLDIQGRFSAASLRPGFKVALRTAQRNELMESEYLVFRT